MKQVAATLNECKVANRNLQETLAKGELTSLTAFRGYKRMEMLVEQLRLEKELLRIAKQEFDLSSSGDVVSCSPSKSKVLEAGEPQYMAVVPMLVCKTCNCAVAKVSQLGLDS